MPQTNRPQWTFDAAYQEELRRLFALAEQGRDIGHLVEQAQEQARQRAGVGHRGDEDLPW